MKNDLFLRALKRQPIERTPIWIMRQAGRYLPEYRATRAKAGDFLTLCQTPELACEVTLQPLKRFDLDAAILFSDILTIPDAMGLGLKMEESRGPVFERSVRTHRDIENISVIDPMLSLRYVMDAVKLIKSSLAAKLPLIGFSGSPWTLASYMVEGKGTKTFSEIKKMLYAEPKMLHQLLKKLSDSVTLYLQAQIESGVDAVMIFDTWGGILTPTDYLDFSLYYMNLICSSLKNNPIAKNIPIIVFTKNGGQWIEAIANIGCDAIGLDWTTNLADAKKIVGSRVTLQGNLDPAVLYTNPNAVSLEAKKVLDNYGFGHGHIFNLGHGITPDINPDNVSVLIETVHNYSKKYHKDI